MRLNKNKVFLYLLCVLFVAVLLVSFDAGVVNGQYVNENPLQVPSATPTVVEPISTQTPDVCGFGCGTKPTRQIADTREIREGQIEYEQGVVKIIFFWMEGCPHCVEVKEKLIPQLQSRFSENLVIKDIELITVDEIDTLFLIGIDQGLQVEQIGVPFVMIGEHILVGSIEIPARLPVLIEEYLQKGGVGYPDNFYLGRYLPVSSPTPASEALSMTPSPTVTMSPTKEIPPLKIYFFWGEGCPHCAKAKPFLEQLTITYPKTVLESFEIYYVAENQELLRNMGEKYGFSPRYVPTIFIGDDHWEGFSDAIQSQIEAAVQACTVTGCPDAGEGVIGASIIQEEKQIEAPAIETPEVREELLSIPLIGEVDLGRQSLLLSTILISFIDGFNPCSIWVLSILLAITLHSGSRKKVLIIGLVFITVTAAVYALFISGLFTVLTFISFSGWIQVIVALVALFFAIINIKDYFWYREGLSLTIDEKKKPGIYQRIRRVLDAGDSIGGLVGGTIILAAGVSLVEFSCTAGFPVLWTNLLAAQKVTTGTFIFLLLVYMLIYQLDELGIFLVSVFTLRSSKLEEKHGRILKLIGGVLMLTLAGVMLINPGLMNNLGSSVIIFGIAFAITILVLLIHRYLLPKFGINVGTESSKKKGKTSRKGMK